METRWTPRPSEHDVTAHLSLHRVTPNKPTLAVILSPDVIGLYTHYWRGRSVPCQPFGCPACEAHQRPRWYGYLGIWNPNNGSIAVLELTPPAIAPIDAWLKRHPSLRAAQIIAKRANKRPNSRLVVEIRPDVYNGEFLPPPPQVERTLEHIWESSGHHRPDREEAADAASLPATQATTSRQTNGQAPAAGPLPGQRWLPTRADD